MKLKYFVLLLIVLSGCSNYEYIYITHNESCVDGFTLKDGNNGTDDICVDESLSLWNQGLFGYRIKGKNVFEKDYVKCDNITIYREHEFDCYEIRQIIDLDLEMYPKETIILSECNYPEYNTREVIGVTIDWRNIFIEECFIGEKNGK